MLQLDWSRVSILSAGMADALLALRCGKAKQCRPHDRLELVELLVRVGLQALTAADQTVRDWH